jgi:membrane fusion protein (multidrug efflux system)
LNNPIVVPFKAVTEQMGEYFVYAVQNDSARQKKITLGPSVGDKVVIQEGLNVGDKIVVDGIQKLREGAPVQVGAPQQSPAAATSAAK